MNLSHIRKIARIEEIPDILPDQAGKVMNDYSWSGAEVSRELQADGNVKVIAKFYTDARYPASGEAVIRK